MKLSGPIVLVDDDKDDQEIIAEVFSLMEIPSGDLRVFSNCSDAYEYLTVTKERPFIILCDINLPVLNGLQFRKSINENDYLRKKSIPFVFYSTSASFVQVSEAYNQTVQGFFVKGVSIPEIQKTLRKIIDYWLECVHPNSIR